MKIYLICRSKMKIRSKKKIVWKSSDIVSRGTLANRVRVRFLRKLAKVGGYESCSATETS